VIGDSDPRLTNALVILPALSDSAKGAERRTSLLRVAPPRIEQKRQFSHFDSPQKPFALNFSPFNTLPLPSPRPSRKFAQAGEKYSMAIRQHNSQLGPAPKTPRGDCGRMFSNPSR
jgi:hypothetical protein